MATAIPVVTASITALTDLGAGVSADTTNGNSITLPANAEGTRLLLHIDTGTAGTITLVAGEQPPSIQGPLGDLVLTLPTGVRILAIDPGRFRRPDGQIRMTFSSGTVATLRAFLLPVQ